MATTQVDATLKVTGADGTSRPLSVEDLNTGRTGAATETTLAAILAELGAKLEPTDVAALATAARQDAAHDVLNAISQAIGAPAAASVLALLTTLNTAARPTTLPGASGLIIADTTLMGFSVKEATNTAGATAAMRLRAGSATGTILATVTLAQNESTSDWYGPSGITATGGVFLELLTGSIAGGVQTR